MSKEPNKLTPLELIDLLSRTSNKTPAPNRRQRRKYKLDEYEVKIIKKADQNGN